MDGGREVAPSPGGGDRGGGGVDDNGGAVLIGSFVREGVPSPAMRAPGCSVGGSGGAVFHGGCSGGRARGSKELSWCYGSVAVGRSARSS